MENSCAIAGSKDRSGTSQSLERRDSFRRGRPSRLVVANLVNRGLRLRFEEKSKMPTSGALRRSCTQGYNKRKGERI